LSTIKNATRSEFIAIHFLTNAKRKASAIFLIMTEAPKLLIAAKEEQHSTSNILLLYMIVVCV